MPAGTAGVLDRLETSKRRWRSGPGKISTHLLIDLATRRTTMRMASATKFGQGGFQRRNNSYAARHAFLTTGGPTASAHHTWYGSKSGCSSSFFFNTSSAWALYRRSTTFPCVPLMGSEYIGLSFKPRRPAAVCVQFWLRPSTCPSDLAVYG